MTGIGIGSHPVAQNATRVGQPGHVGTAALGRPEAADGSRAGASRAGAPAPQEVSPADRDAARVRALAAYKDFLTLWKEADPDIPILKQAKAEYAKLQ